MRRLILFLFLILVISCTTKNKNDIKLFNNISFEMRNGETLMDIHSSIKEMYTEYFNNQQIQIPLFKYIKHRNYIIFIGIPYETSIHKMTKIQLEKPDSSRLFFESNNKSFFNKYKKNRFYITEYSILIENNSMIYISTMTNSKEISDSLFNKSEIVKRIKIEGK
jgi:hypothetical protein